MRALNKDSSRCDYVCIVNPLDATLRSRTLKGEANDEAHITSLPMTVCAFYKEGQGLKVPCWTSNFAVPSAHIDVGEDRIADNLH